jgi:hypothetical protein
MSAAQIAAARLNDPQGPVNRFGYPCMGVDFLNGFKATLNKPSKISAQTWMTQFFGLLCLSRGPFGQFAGR